MENIALALSGGGLRATLFHLGLIRYLAASSLLPRVKLISAVSGGSITAAHVLKNWGEYTSGVASFERAATELRRLADLDLRSRIVLRVLPLIPAALVVRVTRLRPIVPRTSTELLERYYKKYLYGSTRLSDLEGDPLPEVFLVATNLTRGEAAGFWRGGILNIPIDGGPPTTVRAPGIRLATAVAASSAYPGLFPPLELAAGQIAAQQDEFEVEGFTDGGVTDNLGLFVLNHASEHLAIPLDTVIVSDAGRSYVGLDRTNTNFVWTALRSTDLMMHRIREQQLSEVEARCAPRARVVAISDSSEADDSAPLAIESRLKEIRTDLDRFPKELAGELERHGFFVAEGVLGGQVRQEWRPSWKKSDDDRLEQRLFRAAHRGFWPFSGRDWVSYLYAAMAVLAIVLTMKVVMIIKPRVELAARLLTMSKEFPPWDRPANAVTKAAAGGTGDCTPARGVDIVDQNRVWDLRRLAWEKSNGAKDVHGIALLTRSLTLVRDPTGSGVFRFPFQTSGELEAVWIRDGKYPVRLLAVGDVRMRQLGDSEVQPWCVEVDLSKADTSSKIGFSVQMEVADGFLGDNRWVGLRNEHPTPLVSMRLVFSPDVSFENARFSSQPNDRNVQANLDGVEVHQTDTEILWAVYKPRENWTYRVDWDWKKLGEGM